MKGKTLVVTVSTAVPDSEGTMVALEGAIVEKLRQRDLFAHVRAGSATVERATDLLLNVRVTDLSKVTEPLRVFFGGAAGRASITAELELIESATRDSLGTATVEAKGSAGHVFAGTTHQAIELAAEEAVTFVTADR